MLHIGAGCTANLETCTEGVRGNVEGERAEAVSTYSLDKELLEALYTTNVVVGVVFWRGRQGVLHQFPPYI